MPREQPAKGKALQSPGFPESAPACKTGGKKGYSAGQRPGAADPCSSEKGLAARRFLILLLAPSPGGAASPGRPGRWSQGSGSTCGLRGSLAALEGLRGHGRPRLAEEGGLGELGKGKGPLRGCCEGFLGRSATALGSYGCGLWRLLCWIRRQELVLLPGVRLLAFGDTGFPRGPLYKSCCLPISCPFSVPEPLPKHGQPIRPCACLQIRP